MIYKCEQENCGFVFERIGEIDSCPDCGSHKIRFANEDERKEYLQNKQKENNE